MQFLFSQWHLQLLCITFIWEEIQRQPSRLEIHEKSDLNALLQARLLTAGMHSIFFPILAIFFLHLHTNFENQSTQLPMSSINDLQLIFPLHVQLQFWKCPLRKCYALVLSQETRTNNKTITKNNKPKTPYQYHHQLHHSKSTPSLWKTH